MELSFERLMKEMESGKYRPLYLFQGDESYFIDAATRYIEEHALSEADQAFNQVVLYGKEVNPEQISSQAQQIPMMGERQVIIVKEAQGMRGIEKLIPYFENTVKSTVLVLAFKDKALARNTKAFKALAANGVVMQSKSLREYQLRKWLPEHLKENMQLNIQPAAVDLLIEFQGTDIQKLMNEIQKVNIKKDLTEITAQHIQENIGFGKDFDVFEIQDALASRNKKTLTRIIRYFETLMKPSHFIGITALLYNYFSQAYIISIAGKSKAQLDKEMGINEWKHKKLSVGVNHYGYKLETAMQIIKEYELKSKGIGSKNAQPAELLKEMLFKIVNL